MTASEQNRNEIRTEICVSVVYSIHCMALRKIPYMIDPSSFLVPLNNPHTSHVYGWFNNVVITSPLSNEVLLPAAMNLTCCDPAEHEIDSSIIVITNWSGRKCVLAYR